MPSLPSPVVGPLGPVWTPILQAATAQKMAAANLRAQAQQGATYDRWQNVTTISGSNLNQTVELGGTFNTTANTPVSGYPKGGVAGVSVGTGLTAGMSGVAAPTAIATGLITLNGTTSATLVSTISGTFTSGMQIGASILNATTGVTSQAITPGTHFTISGTAITLILPYSAAPIGTGSSLYCVAVTFSQVI